MSKAEEPKDEKNYDCIVRLKKQGDFSTIFATKVEGSLSDPFITVYTISKSGVEKKREISSAAVEEIEREVTKE